MTSKSNNPQHRPTAGQKRFTRADGRTIDVTPLWRACRDVAGWALDLAEAEVGEFPEDIERIDRVRAFVTAGLAGGRLPELAQEDALFFLSVLITALDLEFSQSGLAMQAAILGMMANSPSVTVTAPSHRPGCPYARRPGAGRAPGGASHGLSAGDLVQEWFRRHGRH
jgi:hypothetical protein